MEQFEHDTLDLSLDQIRLLRIYSRTTEAVQCTLETFERETCPPYEALSYAWGPKTDMRSIELNRQRFVIRKNLWDFLDIISSGELLHAETGKTLQTSYLWIDQICINQNIVEEKNQQVKRMDEVYSRAKQVIIWLGAGTSKTEELLSNIMEYKVPKPKGSDCPTYLNRDRPSPTSAELEAFSILFSVPYWSRLWVVQELSLATSRIICFGRRFMDWNELYDCSSVLSLRDTMRGIRPMLPENHPFKIKTVESMLLRRFVEFRFPGIATPETGFLWAVLEDYSMLDCEDARDKVFGLNALMREESRVVVDYSKPAAQIFWEVIALIVAWPNTFLETNNQWILPLGQAMGVTGREANAIRRDVGDNEGTVAGFVWPIGFFELRALPSDPHEQLDYLNNCWYLDH